MKLILLSLPYRRDYMRNARCDFISLSGTQWFPLLLGYAGAFLESKGYEVKLIDAPSYHLSFADVERIYLEYQPDFLAVYAGDKSRDSDIEFSDRLLTKRKIPAAFIGPYFAIEPSYFLTKSKEVSCGVVGEFEYPLWELAQGNALAGINNLIWREGGVIKESPKRLYLGQEELDAIPFVSGFFDRHLDFKRYRTPSEPHPFVDIMTGRGCGWGVCTFCLWVHTYITGKTYNIRSIGNVMEELKFIDRKMPYVRSVMIQDDTFPRTRIIEFCEEKLKRNLSISWSCYVRADLDFDTLKLMKRANCLNLHVGFESANNEVLKKIRKGLTKERMTQFAHDAKRAGLRIHGDFLVGLPGETRESLHELIDWACTIQPYTAQFQIFIPFKGTPLYGELGQKNFLLEGATNYPDLRMRDLEQISKQAYRRFYFSWFYLGRVIRHPWALFFKKFGTIVKSLGAIFWRKMDIR